MVKVVVEENGYVVVVDRVFVLSIIFVIFCIDVSNEVLVKLGYLN